MKKKMSRILTWNIGSFVFLKYGKYFGFRTGNKDEYFRPDVNGDLVSKTIEKINPDFLYLQEFWSPKDANQIECLKKYPHKMFLDMWYRKKGVLIASKKPFSFKMINRIPIVNYKGCNIIPIHLNSYIAAKRFRQEAAIERVLPDLKGKEILMGDTNLWEIKNIFLFSKDRQTYIKFTRSLTDISKKIESTNFFGFATDKVFASKDLKIGKISSPRIRGSFMDHDLIYFDLEI